MMSGDTSLTGPSTLHDEAFFDTSSLELGLDFMVRRCLAQDRAQVLIDAPRAVDAGARATVPVAGVWCRTLREDLAVRWQDRAAVVAVRLDDGTAAAGRVIAWKQSAEEPPVADDDPGEGFAADGFVCDLRARTALPWDGGTWAITVLLAGYASQRVFTHVSGDPPAARAAPWPPTTDARFPSYRPSPGTPAVPRAHGVAMDPARVVVLTPDVRCVLTGSFRLPASMHLAAPEGATAHGAPCARVVPLTVVSTRDDALEPHAVTLYVPCDDLSAEGDVTGVFSVDLFEVAEFSRQPGEVRLWAFAGHLVEGPFPMELVSEDELAPK